MLMKAHQLGYVAQYETSKSGLDNILGSLRIFHLLPRKVRYMRLLCEAVSEAVAHLLH